MDVMSDLENGTVKASEVKELLGLLQYQDGAIVSHVLLKNKGGTVTLFAFDEGEGLSEHTAPFDALVVVLDGEADIEIAGAGYRVRQGETITLPANRPHAVKAATPFKMLLIMIRAQELS
jgi:quercetin dioxygenase-like cupin family protein